MSDNKEINQDNLAEEDPETKGMVDVDPNTVEASRNVQPMPATAFLAENSVNQEPKG
jgi:hypothetical protein